MNERDNRVTVVVMERMIIMNILWQIEETEILSLEFRVLDLLAIEIGD
jgi:hypothetical protein